MKIGLALFIGGLFVAEAWLSQWTGMQYDMNIWLNTGAWMNQGTNIYLPANHLGYPPLWGIWCLAAYRIYELFGNNMEAWRFTVKLPLLLAQFALAFAMGKFAQKRFGEKTARKIFLFAVTWIFFIYIGALWGQLNMLSALLTFLAFYAVVSKRTLVGAVLLGLAVTLKIYPLVVLPAFLAYVWKNKGKGEAGKFGFATVALPVIFTLAVFAIYQWDILYLLKTIFYWTPVFDTNPVLMQGGCMNIWSFLSLLNVDISQVAILRFVWIPVLAAAVVYWFRKPSMDESDFSLSLISFYVLFMISYAWVPEQSFLDVLPFVFLQIFGYRAKRSYLYVLVAVQVLVFAFSAVNWGPFMFEPLLKQFSPSTLAAIQFLNPANPTIWTVREVLGLVVSLSLGFFLLALAKPEFFKQARKRIEKKLHASPER
jgi:hypothetical protein